MQRIERTFAGRRLVIETGRMAKQAAGSALVQFGETMVLAAVTVSDNESPLNFFPLLVEYRDKAYAAGKIPGGFIKREGRPSDAEILKARIIDRSIRPLFPEGFKNEVQVFIYVISADQENDADVLGLLAASYAINSSRIPFMGPIAGVRVGRVQEKWILNPTFQQLPYSDMDVVLAASKDSIMMVEGGARCDIRKRDWKPLPRPAECPQEVGYGQGLEIPRGGEAGFVCAGDTALDPSASSLSYGTASRVGGSECISRADGVTCVNQAGHGFFISIQSYQVF